MFAKFSFTELRSSDPGRSLPVYMQDLVITAFSLPFMVHIPSYIHGQALSVSDGDEISCQIIINR